MWNYLVHIYTISKCKGKWKVVYASFSEMDTDVSQYFETTGSLLDNCIQTDVILNSEVKH